MIDLNEGYPNGWLRDNSLKSLLEELSKSTDEILMYHQPTKAMRKTHRVIVNELCYRLNNLLVDP